MVGNYKIKFRSVLSVLLLGVIVSGCASYGSNTYSIITPEVKSVSSDNNNVQVTVFSNAWNGNPQNLPSYLTVFYIEIENRSPVPITVQYDDIVLIDQSRNQYNALLPDTAANIVSEKSKSKWYFRPSISIGFGSGGYYGGYYGGRYRGGYGFGIGGYGYGYPYYRSPFYWPYNYAYYNNYYSDYYDRDYSDLFTSGLVPGIIRPNAKLSGFVFFNKLPKEISKFELDFSYRIEGTEKKYNLLFPYSVLTNTN